MKMPNLLDSQYISSETDKDELLEDLMYIIYASHYKKKEPFLV